MQKIIKIVEKGVSYKIVADDFSLGRVGDNNALVLKIIRPQVESGKLMRMKLEHKKLRLPDVVFYDADEIEIGSWITKFDNLQISFEFSGSNGYIKNTNIETFMIGETITGREPIQLPIPLEPFDILQSTAITKVEESSEFYVYKNMFDDVMYSIAKPNATEGSGITQPSFDGAYAYFKDNDNYGWALTYTSHEVDKKMSEHNVSSSAHEDIRAIFNGNATKLNNKQENELDVNSAYYAKEATNGIPTGGARGTYLMKNSDEDFNTVWKGLSIEKLHSLIVDLIEDQSVEITLPTAIVGADILTKVYANGVLDGIQGDGIVANGNKILYTPTFTANDAKLSIIYGGSEYELPTN